ncbi:hypothetical protein DFP72DRAFT_856883 [Ephemerocybe angulata]|uniref:Uncharacterized protein n=1 Tax=Ephemerocybe angulata TaxID=980116 RepID=A0A8H6LXR2_9AGAR|nr:hypothetical protein DFP72DRAFT_856883 [Tulosesus angulatus]
MAAVTDAHRHTWVERMKCPNVFDHWIESLSIEDRVDFTVEVFQAADTTYAHKCTQYYWVEKEYNKSDTQCSSSFLALAASRFGAVYNIREDPKANLLERYTKLEKQVLKASVDRRVALWAVRSLVMELEVKGLSDASVPLLTILRENSVDESFILSTLLWRSTLDFLGSRPPLHSL